MILAEARAGVTDPAQETRHDGSAGGRAYIRIVITDASGVPHVEHWAIEGLGHAWSGGSPEGSHTDQHGPDASREMLRFFLGGPPEPLMPALPEFRPSRPENLRGYWGRTLL
jgi:poly(3-hydroxybutyrate) depolymerase